MTLEERFQELQSLDPNNPGAWPLWVRIGAVIVAALVILGGGYKLAVQPQLDELSRQQAQENSLFDDFQSRQKKVAALDAYREQLKEMEKLFGNMLRLLPSKAEVANLLNDISQTRVAASLEEELFRPMADVPKDFYAELPNQIVVNGNYHQMGQFVSGVAALPRIVTIEDVDIRPMGQPANNGGKPAVPTEGSPVLHMQAIAKTYRYLDESEQAASKPSGPPGTPGAPR
ncbi:MAG TPA: type 4a pilus biogenesis protein PilO [Nevskiaceae bacterium]|nr:type 4a pilus biogenesis protein PilO [Nevskiaceae bacterium]